MRNFTWNRFPIKNLLIDSLLTPIVESTYWLIACHKKVQSSFAAWRDSISSQPAPQKTVILPFVLVSEVERTTQPLQGATIFPNACLHVYDCARHRNMICFTFLWNAKHTSHFSARKCARTTKSQHTVIRKKENSYAWANSRLGADAFDRPGSAEIGQSTFKHSSTFYLRRRITIVAFAQGKANVETLKCLKPNPIIDTRKTLFYTFFGINTLIIIYISTNPRHAPS